MANGICPFARQVYGVTTFSPGNGGRVGFCDHAAGGFFGTMLSSAFWNGAGTSVHFAISRDGEVAQLVNVFDTAFAQGRLGPSVTWPPYAAMGSSNPNGYLISTEHEDWTLVNGKATAVPGSQWTAAEYAADLKVKRWCIDEVKRVTGENLMRFGLDSLAGHFMFDGVNRRDCPGLYWTQDYRQRLFNDLTQGEDDMANLNADGSQRIVSEGTFIVTYNNNIPVTRLGSTDGKFPGRMSKNFGGTWLWFRTLNDQGQLVAPYWSPTEGD